MITVDPQALELAQAQILDLATLEVACGPCRGTGHIEPAQHLGDGIWEMSEELYKCTRCHGIGTMPRFEGLRFKCERWGLFLNKVPYYYTSGVKHFDECSCGGREWFPVSIATAATELRKLKEFEEWIVAQMKYIQMTLEAVRELIQGICDDVLVIKMAHACFVKEN